jgi:Phage portal protein
MAWYNLFKKENKSIEVVEGYQSFSTPFLPVGKGDLSLPYVNGRYSTNMWVRFGNDNLFSQLLNQMYFSSPLHGAICDYKTNAVIGGGFALATDKLTTPEKLELYMFERKTKLKHTVKAVTRQLIVHNRIYFKLCFDSTKKLVKIENVSPEKVRISRFKDMYYLCDDWSTNIEITSIKPYHVACSDYEQLYCYEIKSLGQDYYSLPQYTSALNFAFLSGELSFFAKSNIQNSIFPSFAMMFPKRPQSEEEKHMIKETLERLKGASNSGKAVAFFANSQEQLPKIEALPNNNNDKLFQEASQLNTEQICFAHTIDPILMGIRTTGSLGGGADIKQAYVIFEKNVVMELRSCVSVIFNELLTIARIPAEFTINNFQIINENIVELEGDTSKTNDALNSLSPLVATKVLETMTINEVRALASLPPIEGGDLTQSASNAIVVTPTTPIV